MAVDLHRFADIHSHSRRGSDVITCLPLPAMPDTPPGEAWYSVGLHPWDIGRYVEQPDDIKRWIEAAAADERVVAIGECGLDSIHRPAAPDELQEQLLLWQADVAVAVGKPLILHCAGRWHRLLALARRMPPGSVIHGFRGKADTARQLLRAGYDISFGLRYNEQAYDAVPPERRYRETD